MSNENFFKHDDKAYAENLNDAILIANAFDYQVPVNIPGMYGNNHYPNDNNIHKVGVADVTIVSSGSLSIGDTAITNNSNTSQVLRLRVYPNFNSFYAWKRLNWTCTGAVTVNICDAGTSTSLLPSGALTNPDNETLLNGISSLQGLKEYDLLITIPVNGILNTLSLVFVNNWNSNNRVSASISQANVTGLESSLDGLASAITTGLNGKVDKVTGKQLSTNDFDNTYKADVDAYTDCNEEHINYYGNMGYTDGVSDNPLVIEKVGRVMHLHGTWKTSSSISIRSQTSKVLGLFSSPAPNYPIHSSQLITNGGLYEIMVSPRGKIELTNVSKSSDLTIPANTVCYVNVMWILDY